MDELLFTADDLKRYKDNSYLFEIVNPGEKEKAKAIQKYFDNEKAIEWLQKGYYEADEQEYACDKFGFTIASALMWYARFQNFIAEENNSFNIYLKRPENWIEIAKMIQRNRLHTKKILIDNSAHTTAVKALTCWNYMMPNLVSYNNVHEREQSKPCTKGEEITDNRDDASRPDQTLETAASAGAQEQREVIANRILQNLYDIASEPERQKYFFSGRGRHGNQNEYFASSLDQFIKDSGGSIVMERFIKDYVRPFKRKLQNGITDKENG